MGSRKGGDDVSKKGKGGKVRLAIEALERNCSPIKKPRFVKPYGKRGVMKDNLVQMQISSLVGNGRNKLISGLVRAGDDRKCKLES